MRSMLTRGRVITALVLLVIVAIGWSIWLTVQTAGDLRRAQTSAEALQSAFDSGDAPARVQATADLQEAAASAHDHTDGAGGVR